MLLVAVTLSSSVHEMVTEVVDVKSTVTDKRSIENEC